MGTFNVLDATGGTQAVTNNANGRQAAASSAPAALCTEDKAALDLINTNLTTALTVLAPQPMMAAGAPLTTLAFTEVIIAESTSGDRTIVSATSGQTTKVYRMVLQAGATGLTVLVKDGASTTLQTLVLAANQGFILDFSQYPWYTTTANTAFILNLSASVALNGRLYYIKSA